jgi:hypothetical protein
MAMLYLQFFCAEKNIHFSFTQDIRIKLSTKVPRINQRMRLNLQHKKSNKLCNFALQF